METPLQLLCLTRDDELINALRETLVPFGESVALVATDPANPDGEKLSQANGVLCGSLPPALRSQMPRLRWVQIWGAGVDGKIYPELWANGVTVTNAAGMHASVCAEHILSLMLAFARGLPQCFQAQKAREWSRTIGEQVFDLDGKTVGIVGAGRIGQAIGSRCQAFGMKTVGTRRDPDQPTPGIDVVLSHLQYHDLLLASDFVVLALPLTPNTRLIFGEDEIEIIRRTAYLFNIGRGGLIDETWLLKALQNRWIAGAGLDVFADEPLPPTSPFWDLPNCIITPHIGGATPRYWQLFARLVAEQVGRLTTDTSLENQVSAELGY